MPPQSGSSDYGRREKKGRRWQFRPNRSSGNWFPVSISPQRDSPPSAIFPGFLDFLAPLHQRFAPRQRELIEERKRVLANSSGRKAHSSISRGSRSQRLAHRVARVVPGPAQPDDRPRRRRRARGQDAELGRARRNARSRRFHRQRVGAPAAWASKTFWRRCAATLTYFDKKRDRHRRHSAQQDRHLDPRRAACTCTRAGFFGDEPTSASLFDVARVAFQIDPSELKHPLCLLHSEVRIGRRSAVVARSVSSHRRSTRLAARLHQVHGAGGIASAGLPDGRVPLQPARSHCGLEPWPLGLHGQPNSLQPDRSRVGAARSQHHSAQCSVLPESARAFARDLPQARSAGHRRHDRALSQPRRRGTQRARPGRTGRKTRRTKPTA